MKSRLQNHINIFRVYEDPILQVQAQSCIPVDELISKANDTLAYSKKNGIKETSYTECLVKQLLHWFKRSFFKWVNTLPCSRCGGKTKACGSLTPTNEEMLNGGSRVENHFCDKCGHGERFPRFNNPGKLLETRRGRCGEWANCFTLCCKAMQLETRYVLDFTDHVWCEVFIERLNSWVHVDCCENAFNKPLMYETGWKKKLSYIFAFTSEEVADVAWRYSKNHTDLLTRRKEVTEKRLCQILFDINTSIQQHLSPERVQLLQERSIRECLAMIISNKTVSMEECVGRTSGSLRWRLGRGETQSNAVLIEPTAEEISQKCLQLQYCPSRDVYERKFSTPSIYNGWHSLINSMRNIARKEEYDHNMVYLARVEGTSDADITWTFDLRQVVLDKIEIKFLASTFSTGKINVTLMSPKNSIPLSTEHVQTFSLAELSTDESSLNQLSITARLSYGLGDVAWQHTQLFRQGLNSENIYPFYINIRFK